MPNEEGVWILGTVTAPEIPDLQIFNLYVGKAADALKAEKTIGSHKNVQAVVDKLAKQPL